MSYLHPAKMSPTTLSVQGVLISLAWTGGLRTQPWVYSHLSMKFGTGIFLPYAEGLQWLVLQRQLQIAGLKKIQPSAQGLVSGFAGQFRVVIVLRKVRQHQ